MPCLEPAAAQEMLEATAGVTVVRRATMELQKDEQTSAVAPATIADWAAMVRGPPRHPGAWILALSPRLHSPSKLPVNDLSPESELRPPTLWC